MAQFMFLRAVRTNIPHLENPSILTYVNFFAGKKDLLSGLGSPKILLQESKERETYQEKEGLHFLPLSSFAWISCQFDGSVQWLGSSRMFR